MNIDEFQTARLAAYLKAHTTPELDARINAEAMTVSGAYKWIVSRLRALAEDTNSFGDGNMVGDDEWCYEQMMWYFANCKEGDEAKSQAQLAREAKDEEARKAVRAKEAEKKRKDHAERVSKWATFTPEQIRLDIYRSKNRYKWLAIGKDEKGKDFGKSVADMTDEELTKALAYADEKAKSIKAKADAKYKKEKERAERKAELDNPKPVSGYLLEFYDEVRGEWYGSEFCVTNLSTNIWKDDELMDEFRSNEVQIGFYPELGDGVWAEDFDDWDFRLGIMCDLTEPTPSGYWGGISTVSGDMYRVSKATVSGVMSEKAKDFFMRHPSCTWEITK